MTFPRPWLQVLQREAKVRHPARIDILQRPHRLRAAHARQAGLAAVCGARHLPVQRHARQAAPHAGAAVVEREALLCTPEGSCRDVR